MCVLFYSVLFVCLRMHMPISLRSIAGVPFDSARRFRASVLLQTTWLHSCCNWRASCVVAKHKKIKKSHTLTNNKQRSKQIFVHIHIYLYPYFCVSILHLSHNCNIYVDLFNIGMHVPSPSLRSSTSICLSSLHQCTYVLMCLYYIHEDCFKWSNINITNHARKMKVPKSVSKQIWICTKSFLICTEDFCLYCAPWHRTNSI